MYLLHQDNFQPEAGNPIFSLGLTLANLYGIAQMRLGHLQVSSAGSMADNQVHQDQGPNV